MAATLTDSDQGVRLAGKLVAGDSATFRSASEMDFPEGARLRWTLTDARPPDARHTVAASDEIDPASATEAKMSLKTAEIRQAFRGLRITEAIPAVLELVDTVNDAVYCSLRVQVCNSRALWLGNGDALDGLSGLTAADVRRYLLAHEARRDNPHGVTASQVGAATSAEVASAIAGHASDTDAHGLEEVRTRISSVSATAENAKDAVGSHTADKQNPHSVTEAQLVEASGTQAKSGKYLRIFNDDPETGAYSNEKLTFFGKTIFKGETECGETKTGSLEVTGGAIVHSVLAVFGGPFYLEDLDSPGAMYELSVRGGKLYFNNVPISSDSVRSMKA